MDELLTRFSPLMMALALLVQPASALAQASEPEDESEPERGPETENENENETETETETDTENENENENESGSGSGDGDWDEFEDLEEVDDEDEALWRLEDQRRSEERHRELEARARAQAAASFGLTQPQREQALRWGEDRVRKWRGLNTGFAIALFSLGGANVALAVASASLLGGANWVSSLIGATAAFTVAGLNVGQVDVRNRQLRFLLHDEFSATPPRRRGAGFRLSLAPQPPRADRPAFAGLR